MSTLTTGLQARRERLAALPELGLALPPPYSDLAVRQTAQRIDASAPGKIDIYGAPFISDPIGAEARLFLSRAFTAAPVQSVLIDAVRGKAQIQYQFQGDDPRDAIRVLSQAISGKTNARPVSLPETFGRGSRGRVRLQRYGDRLSGWAIRHEIPGRIRFESPVLVRGRALRQAIEAEFVNAFGVDKFSVQELTGSVLVHYNARPLQKHQIVPLLDGAFEKTEDFSLAPIDYDLPVSTATVALSTVSQFFLPVLTPVSAALFLYSVIPSFKGAYDILVKERKLGVDVLYAIVVAACLATNQIFADSVLA